MDFRFLTKVSYIDTSLLLLFSEPFPSRIEVGPRIIESRFTKLCSKFFSCLLSILSLLPLRVPDSRAPLTFCSRPLHLFVLSFLFLLRNSYPPLVSSFFLSSFLDVAVLAVDDTLSSAVTAVAVDDGGLLPPAAEPLFPAPPIIVCVRFVALNRLHLYTIKYDNGAVLSRYYLLLSSNGGRRGREIDAKFFHEHSRASDSSENVVRSNIHDDGITTAITNGIFNDCL